MLSYCPKIKSGLFFCFITWTNW